MKSLRPHFSLPRRLARVAFAATILFAVGCASGAAKRESEATRLDPGPSSLVPRNFGPAYKYNELLTRDYDEMFALVQTWLKKSRAANASGEGGDAEAVEYLGRALKLIFSRPDSDNMVTKLLTEPRRELSGYSAYDETLEALAVDALKTAKNSDSTVIASVTALVELENMLGEIRPDATNGNPTMLRIVTRIRDANISISDEVKRERRLRGMFRSTNPSTIATEMLKVIDAAKKHKA